MRLCRCLLPLLCVLMVSCASHAGTVVRIEPPTGVEGAWAGPAQCQHGDGETLRMTITRVADGTYRGATDWARSSQDGRHGPLVPFTTIVVDGNHVTATHSMGDRTVRLDATLEGDTIRGHWAIDGDSDRWTFTAAREDRPADGSAP